MAADDVESPKLAVVEREQISPTELKPGSHVRLLSVTFLTRQSEQLGRRINTNDVTAGAGETQRDRGLATPDVQHANMLLNVDVGEQLTNDELLPNGIAR